MTPRALAAVRDTLRHRGPDSAGLIAWLPDGSVAQDDQPAMHGLGHRRLSIIDLSPAGQQPMANENRSVWLTYNGEFYNFAEYREDLERRGHVFSSHSDTETIIHLYEEFGIDETVRKMNGMFAFAIWDAPRRRLVLARDRFGKKPLFYVLTPDGGIVFASEAKALVASGFVNKTDLDAVAFDETLSFGTPLGERSIFSEIHQIPAAHYAVWENGRLEIRRYWSLPLRDKPVIDRPLDDLADELDELLTDSIRLRLISDVPVGLFLSGGIDSSLIAAIIAKKIGRPLQAFTVGFSESGYDESRFAKEVAEYLGLPIVISEESGLEKTVFDDVAKLFYQPFGDASAYSSYMVARLARREVTVALTGDGGDELFGGYHAYSLARYIWGGDATYKMDVPAGWARRLRLRGFKSGFLSLHSVFGLRTKCTMYRNPLQAVMLHLRGQAERGAPFSDVEGRAMLDQMQYLDQTILTDSILRKVDRTSMAVGLECRCPLLDYRIAEFAATLTPEVRMGPDGVGKLILRHLLRRYLPEKFTTRSKQGFCTPWEFWCKGDYAAQLRARWRACPPPLLRAGAAEIVFPSDGSGSAYRMWTAFTHLVFAESLKS